jgi:hypothetical protein
LVCFGVGRRMMAASMSFRSLEASSCMSFMLLVVLCFLPWVFPLSMLVCVPLLLCFLVTPRFKGSTKVRLLICNSKKCHAHLKKTQPAKAAQPSHGAAVSRRWDAASIGGRRRTTMAGQGWP